MSSLDALIDIVVTGKMKEAKDATQKCLDEGIDAKTIIFEGLSNAMGIVGEKYAAKQYFLPQVLLAANTLYQGLNICLPLLQGDGSSSKGTVILAVVEGDVHDIGKNIVKAMLTGLGCNVVDMGKDIPVKDIIASAQENKAQIIATSTLMTPTLACMKQLEADLKESGQKGTFKTMIGGGATSKEFADQIGADAWSYDAVEASHVAGKFLGI